MNGEPKLMKMPNYSKKRLKDGMIRESKSGNSKWVSMFIVQFSFYIFCRKLLSKWEGPYIIEEVYRSGAIKINNFKGTNPRVLNGQTIKHYISGTPINVETNIIQTMTTEQQIRETFQNTLEP